MSTSHQRTLAGISPTAKSYLSFTDTPSAVNTDATVAIGPIVADWLVNDFSLSALLNGMLSSAPTLDTVWTLPLATTILANLTQFNNVDVGDGFQFIIRNQAAPGSGFTITLNVNTGITADSEANLVIQPGTSVQYILRCNDPNPLAGQANFEIFQIGGQIAGGPLASTAYLTTQGTGVTTQGVTATTPEAIDTPVLTVDTNAVGITNTASTITVTNAGIYKIDMSLNALTGTTAMQVIMHISVDAVLNTQRIGVTSQGITAALEVGGAGTIITSLVAGAVITPFIDVTLSGDVTVTNTIINIVRIA